MAHVIEDMNEHPCKGKLCEDCETCIFDVDIDAVQPIKNAKTVKSDNSCGQLARCFSGMNACETCEFNEFKDNTMTKYCNDCPYMIKNFIDDDKLAFNACCGKVIIDYGEYSEPRLIKKRGGLLLNIDTPEWCPKKNGIDKQVLKPVGRYDYKDVQDEQSTPSKVETTRKLTYYEKRDALKKLPRHLEWDEIKENEVFVIPKILTQPRKVIRVIFKTNSMIRYSEINDKGTESNYYSTIYPSDIEAIFITKFHKF